MLLLRMPIRGRAPLGRILDPAQRRAHWKAALPSAFIRRVVRVKKVLAIASEHKKKHV